MKFTGERFELGLGGQIEYEHLHRFAACRELVRGKVVLDIASGAGIGSAIFAQTAEHVVGVDIDHPSVREARQRCSEIGNVSFVVGSCSAIPVRDSHFDVVISFETIEHIAEQEEFLREVRRVLKPDGVFVVSTPDHQIYSVNPNFKNPFHVRELDREEFRTLLHAHFPMVAMYGQRLATASFLLPLDVHSSTYAGFTKSEQSIVRAGTSLLNDPVYLLAVCAAAGQLVDLSPSLYLDREEDIFLRMNEYQNEELRKARVEIVGLRRQGLVEAHWDFVHQCRAEMDRQAAARHRFDQARDARLAAEAMPAPRSSSSGVNWLRKFGVRSAKKEEMASEIVPLFDPQWYIESNSDLDSAGVDPLTHYLDHGWQEGRQPHPLFDADWYVRKNPEVRAEGINPLLHYFRVGWRKRRNPHPLFDSAWYLDAYPEVAAADVEPLGHYLTEGWQQGLDPNPLFSTRYYLEVSPDVLHNGINPLIHYVTQGAAEGRRTHLLFDRDWYLANNPDAAESGLEALTHFLEFGTSDCRDPHPLFASSWCLARDPESQRTGQHPIRRFLAHGIREGQDPHPYFDSKFYTRTNPDVVANGLIPIEHFIADGASEGRDPHAMFRAFWYREANLESTSRQVNPLVHYLEQGIGHGLRPCAEFEPAWFYNPPVYLVPPHKNPFVALAVTSADVLPRDAIELPDRTPIGGLDRTGRATAIAPAFEDAVRRSHGSEIARELNVGLLAIQVYGAAHVSALTYAPLLQDCVDRINERAGPLDSLRPVDVSILMPTGESVAHTFVCIASLLARLGKYNFEIVVQDDGREEVRGLLSGLPFPIRIIQGKPETGVLQGLNAAAQSGSGKCLMFVTRAHFVFPGAVDAMVDALGGGLSQPGFLFDDRGQSLWDDASSDVGHAAGPNRTSSEAARGAAAKVFMIERELWERLGGFNTSLSCADALIDLSARAKAGGREISVPPAAAAICLPNSAARPGGIRSAAQPRASNP